jgi:hypothetical protein
MARTHNNADKRVYRILHTQGELIGKISEIHGRDFFLGIAKEALIVVDISQKFARVAVGWLADVLSKTEVNFFRYVKMVSNWDLIEKVFIFSGHAISRDEKDLLMRHNQPRIPSEDIRVGESRIRIGRKKDKKFMRRIEYASTQPVY